MKRRLRALWTFVISADPPCVECGRPTYYPGAIRAEVCRMHWEERIAKRVDTER